MADFCDHGVLTSLSFRPDFQAFDRERGLLRLNTDARRGIHILPDALGLERISDFLRHVILIMLGQNRIGKREALIRGNTPSVTTPCPSRNRSGRMPT
tara:strand:- start:14088 stop:14381 length:294 start_codon:yes stop_codon:yes gene_type:complete